MAAKLLTKAEIDAIRALKEDGLTNGEIRSKTARSLGAIRKALNGSVTGRAKPRTKPYTWTSTNGVPLKQVLTWYAEDKTLDWIGKQCGKLSREAIRQVVQRGGGKPRGTGYNKHRHKDRIALILVHKDAIFALANKGASMRKLCQKYKATKATLCAAFPDLEAITQANLRRSRFDHEAVSKLWLAGKQLDDIAQTYKTSKGTIGALIQKLRRKYGELMFPRRRAHTLVVVMG